MAENIFEPVSKNSQKQKKRASKVFLLNVPNVRCHIIRAGYLTRV